MAGEHVTVRIPELLAATDPLSLDDRIAIWIAATNKTRHTTLQDLRTLIETGGGASGAPVAAGNRIYHRVTAAEADGSIISLPSLAGKNYFVTRDGVEMFPDEYNVLAGGGLELATAGEFLREGQRFVFDLYEMSGGASGGSSSGGSFITGVYPVTTNLVMTSAQLHKLLQVRAGSSSITITLPDVSTYAVGDIVPIETNISNTFQCKIQTTGGQFIYINNTSRTAIYMGVGECLFLMAGEDGWYLLGDFSKIYREVGDVKPSYKVGVNALLADGSLVPRSAYPRLWEWVQTLGDSLVTDAIWNTASATVSGRTVTNPYRGCFSTGDGSTTFRIPNLMNVALRGVKNTSGSDTERLLNRPGGFQRHEVESHNHSSGSFNRLLSVTGTSTVDSPDNTAGEPNLALSAAIQAYGGTETRMDNVGVLWTINV